MQQAINEFAFWFQKMRRTNRLVPEYPDIVKSFEKARANILKLAEKGVMPEREVHK